jgi:hypothetical protein
VGIAGFANGYRPQRGFFAAVEEEERLGHHLSSLEGLEERIGVPEDEARASWATKEELIQRLLASREVLPLV